VLDLVSPARAGWNRAAHGRQAGFDEIRRTHVATITGASAQCESRFCTCAR
jgi:hypothetical protein